MWYTLAPWSFLVIGLLAVILIRRRITSRLQLFFVCAALSTFVMLSLASGKLQVYLLPAVPFMVYAAVLSLPQYAGRGWVRLCIVVPALLQCAFLPALLFFKPGADFAYLELPAVKCGAVMITLGGGAAVYCLLRRGHDLARAVKCMSAALFLGLFLAGFALPAANEWLGYRVICAQALKTARQEGIEHFAAWGLRRAENLDVYLGVGVTVLANKADPNAEFASSGPVVLITRSRDLPRVQGGAHTEIWGKFALTVLNDPCSSKPGVKSSGF